MNRLETKTLVCMFAIFAASFLLYRLCCAPPIRQETVSELQIGAGMASDLMSSRVKDGGSDSNELLTLFEVDKGGRSKWRSHLALTVSVGCTPEDIFGSREAYIAIFDTNANDYEDAEKTTSNPSTLGLSDDTELLETNTTINDVLEVFRKKYSEPIVIEDLP